MFGVGFVDNVDDDKVFVFFEFEFGIFNDEFMGWMLVDDLIMVCYRDVKCFNYGVMGGI